MKILKVKVPPAPKKDPSIIRRHDLVEIVTPEMFMRCGYEKDLKTLMKEIWSTPEQLQPLAEVLNKLAGNPKYNPSLDLLLSEYPTHYQTALGYLVRGVAYYKLQSFIAKGNVRKIFTEPVLGMKGRTFIVKHIRFCKTGVYLPGYQGNFDYEWVLPYLHSMKTHKILGISEHVQDNWVPDCWHFEIEAVHVKKVTP
jgi:hypothetical protein